MTNFIKDLIPATRSLLFMSILTGLAYPLFVLGVGQNVFAEKANGSLIIRNGQAIGSSLIGQKFEKDFYFSGRPSSTDYSALPSGGTNMGPTSATLKETYEKRAAKLGGAKSEIPQDLLFASGSGLDPDISPAAAFFQVSRIAKARAANEDLIRSLVKSQVQKRDLGFLGEERVNVLKLNLALDEKVPVSGSK